MLPCRELKGIDAIHEAVKAPTLRAERDIARCGDLRGESLDIGHRIEIGKRCLARALSHAVSSLCWQVRSRGNVAPRAIASRGLPLTTDHRSRPRDPPPT